MRHHHQHSSTGFTLIEVLVTLCIGTIAILGLAMLLVQSSQQQQINVQNQKIQLLFDDFRQIALMHKDALNQTLALSPIELQSAGKPQGANGTVSLCTPPCSQQQMLQHQLAEWQLHMQQILQNKPFLLKVNSQGQQIKVHLIWAPFDAIFDPLSCYQTLKNCQQVSLSLG